MPSTPKHQGQIRKEQSGKYLQYCVGDAYAGVRLDKFLYKKLCIPQSLAQKLLRKGLVRVSGHKAVADYRLILGDIILFDGFLASNADRFSFTTNLAMSAADHNKYVQLIKNIVLFEDKHILVVNKPYGICSQGGRGITLSMAGLSQFLSQGKDEEERMRLVHRLDQHTSGVMILAKGYAAARAIGDMFCRGLVKKVYYAVLCGIPRDNAGIIRSMEAAGFSNNTNQQIANSGLEITEYQVISCNSSANNSIVALCPQTGKKHQLRRHMLLLGHPIEGDIKYGNKMQSASRLCLYAHSIDVPGFGKFTATPPLHMQCIENLLL